METWCLSDLNEKTRNFILPHILLILLWINNKHYN